MLEALRFSGRFSIMYATLVPNLENQLLRAFQPFSYPDILGSFVR